MLRSQTLQANHWHETMTLTPRIVIADPQSLIAEAFGKLLAAECAIVACVSDGRSLIDKVREERPDVAVVDLALPLLNGLDAGRQAKQAYPALKVVIVTANEDPELAATALQFGASGYLLKRCPGAELLKAIQEVMRNHTYVTPLITGGVVNMMMRPLGEGRAKRQLTPRQREVLQLLAEGKSMKEAANILHVGVRTIAFHKYRMMEQLNLRNNAELIRFALKQHVVL
jgi:DNA-binding NarL/FixJ family response regulator